MINAQRTAGIWNPVYEKVLQLGTPGPSISTRKNYKI
jgi:hypothetical protein